MHPITSAFLHAAAELGFSFEPSFLLRLPEGEVLETLGLMRDFGSAKGALLFAKGAVPNAATRELLNAEGYFSSELFSSYETYDRDLFTATLDDWSLVRCGIVTAVVVHRKAMGLESLMTGG
jgi:hypothetical protein